MMKAFSPIVQLQILANNRPLQEYHKDDHTFVEGQNGQDFSILLKNLSGKKILVHPTVDGLSAMTGKVASQNDSDHGYILGPGHRLTVPGWRLDDSQVAQFFFAGSGDSYAEKTGKSKDKGVVACAVWEEKVYVDPRPNRIMRGAWPISRGACGQSIGYSGGQPTSKGAGGQGGMSYGEEKCNSGFQTECCVESSSANYGSATKSVTTSNLGTGFGEATSHAVQKVRFVPASEKPIVTAIVYYDNAEGLQARGIKVKNNRTRNLPNPFPKDQDTGCTPPEGWEA